MRIFREWHTINAAFCIYVYSTIIISITQADKLHHDVWERYESKSIEKKQAFKESDDEPFYRTSFQKMLIPIKEPRVDKNFRMFRMPLEPDAEILPAHYTGVKPPGVDHMELKHADSQISQTVPKIESLKKFEQAGNQQLSKNQESASVTGEKGYQKASSFEKAYKGDSLKKKEKTRYIEAGGKKKVHENRENNSGQRAEQIGSKKGGKHKKKDSSQVDHKAAGYRNVYHKDEYKKNHDFYDNDDHGGHSKEHGRYKEKYVTIEGKFKKGDAHDFSFDESELRKRKISGNSQAGGETKGHKARRSYG